MKKLQSLGLITAISVAAVFNAAQPAKAILTNNFTFNNTTGSTTGGVVTGSITFNSLNPGDTATDVAADSLIINSVPSFIEANFDDAFGFQLGANILTSPDLNSVGGNSWNITSGIVSVPNGNTFNANAGTGFNDPGYERVLFRDTNYFVQANNSPTASGQTFARDSSIVFTGDSASVPFEFSPTLGLVLAGSLFGVGRYAKARKASKLINDSDN